MKKKFNSLNVWLTGEEFELGELLYELETVIPPVVYYDKGISAFDDFFEGTNYIKEGYICQILSYQNGICVFLTKYRRDDIVDMGVALIERKYILEFDAQEVDKLIFPKNQKTKRDAIRNWRRMGGIIGNIGSEIIESIDFKVQTRQSKGVLYKCKYINNYNEQKEFSIYTSEEYLSIVSPFLLLYYQPVLGKDLQKPLEQPDGNCFIATACYKNKESDEVVLFRNFRDDYLLTNRFGRAFIRLYYFLSPIFLSLIGNNKYILVRIRKVLDKIYIRIKNDYARKKL